MLEKRPAAHRERPKHRSEKDLIDSLIHDLGKEDLEDRFVKLQMVNQELEEQLERQQYQIEHLTKFLKQADETLRDAITVAERDAWIEIRRAADSSHRECLREIKNLKEQIVVSSGRESMQETLIGMSKRR